MISYFLAQIQPVEPTNVNQIQQEFIIDAGELAGDNIFHTFEQFNLDQGQIAEFLANPQTRNIFNRVIGGDPSIIDGILKVTGGNPDFYFLNPNGIVFGRNAYIDVPAAFYGSTASSVQFGNSGFSQYIGVEWFSHVLSEDESLKESTTSGLDPSFLNFQTLTNPIINLGTIQAGSRIDLSGSNIVSLGNLNAPDIKFSLIRLAFRGYKVSLQDDFWTYLPRNYIPINFLDFRQVYQLNGGGDVLVHTRLDRRAIFVEHFNFLSPDFSIFEIYLGDSLSNQQIDQVFRLGTFGEDFSTDLNLAVQPELPDLPDDPVDEPPDDPVIEPPDDPVTEPPDDPVTEPPDDPVTEPPDDPVTEPPDDPVTEPPDDPVDEPPHDSVDDVQNEGVTLGFITSTSDFLKIEQINFISPSNVCYYPQLVRGDRRCLLRLNIQRDYPEITEEQFYRGVK